MRIALVIGLAGCATLTRNPAPRTIAPWRGAVMESASLSFGGRTASFRQLPLYVRQTGPRTLLVRDSVTLTDSLPGVPRRAEVVMSYYAEETFRNYGFLMRFTGRTICINEAPLYDDGHGVLTGRARVRTMEDAFYARAEVRHDAATGRGTWRVYTDDGQLDFSFSFRDRREGDPSPPPPTEPTDRGEEGAGLHCRALRTQ